MNRKTAILGSICGIMTGVCWGVSGVFGQFLFERHSEITSYWIVPIRMFSAGIMLMIYTMLKNRHELKEIVTRKRDLLQAVLTGVCGCMMFQLSFFMAVQHSNAGTATVMQYLCPVITMSYVCIRDRKLPKGLETVAIISALIGIVLISTHGNFGELVITPAAFIWGLGAAFFMFLSAVIPEKIYTRYSTTTVLACGFIAGGLVLCGIFKPWMYPVKIDFMVLFAMFFIVVAGSVFAYFFYGQAIKMIGPARSTLFSCSEPVVAAVLSAVWLKTHFAVMDVIGFVFIIATIFMLAKPEKEAC